MSTRAFEVEVVGQERSPEDYLRWLQEEYAEEATSWETDEDLADLLAQTRRRRRFQGFGGAYASKGEKAGEESGHTESGEEPVELCKVSGGSHSRAKRKDIRLCPSCGGKVEMFDFTVRVEQVALRDGHLQWMGRRSRAPAAA